MIGSLLVPLDGSRFAEQALPMATALAERTGAKIRLLTVHEPRPDLTPGLDVPAQEGEALEIRSGIQAYLAQVVERLEAGDSGTPVSSEIVDGLAAPALTEAALRLVPDLVVMATHGRGPVSRFWLGSVADHFIRHTSVPALLIRPSGTDLPEPPIIKRILVALDLSDQAKRILPLASNLAKVFGASIVLFNVVEPSAGMVDGALPYPIPAVPGALDQAKELAKGRLESLAEAERATGTDVSIKVVAGVGAAGTILEEADAGYDLVAMTTHGAGGFRRLLLGSVADKVVRAGVHPVLLMGGR